MAAAHKAKIALDRTQYVDLVAIDATLSGLDLTFQYDGHSGCRVYFGGSQPGATSEEGSFLQPGQTIFGGAVDHVWVKGEGFIVPWVS